MKYSGAIEIVEDAIRREIASGPTDEIRHHRVRSGIYGMRGQRGRYVVRLRIPAGILTVAQLEAVANFVEHFGGLGFAHLTTRQGIEIADVNGDQIAHLLRQIEEAGLTTRNTGGNVVRNVVCCPLAGVAADEIFDVTPYALAVDQFFLGASALHQLPRKVKIAFEGCVKDHARTAVADIGLRAALRDDRHGFQIGVGGGLGASPKLAQPLEDFTSCEALFPTLEAILRVFDAHGDRQNRARARLKWLLGRWGLERFREAVFAERASLHMPPMQLPDVEPSPTSHTRAAAATAIPSEPFNAWLPGNVQMQRQDGFVAVQVRCPFGDLTPSQLRRLAAAAQRFAGGVRTTIEQNAVLRWVRREAVADLYEFMRPEELATCCAEQLMDITRCAGAETCLSAITNSKAAARALGAILANGLSREPALRSLRIRVSGCNNSCGHHHAADIGLFGVSKKAHGHPAPHYALLLGGDATAHAFGKRVTEVPACRLVPAVERVLKRYLAERKPEESFAQFVERHGVAAWRAELADFTHIPPPADAPEFYRDLEATTEFTVTAKEGECAS